MSEKLCTCEARNRSGAAYCPACGLGLTSGRPRGPVPWIVGLIVWMAGAGGLSAALHARPRGAESLDRAGESVPTRSANLPEPTPPQPGSTAEQLPQPTSTLDRIRPSSHRASSFFVHGRERHPSAHAFDDDAATAWNDGVAGIGLGEWLEATFDRSYRVRRIRTATGWNYVSARYGDLFVANSHLRRVSFRFSNGSTVTRDVASGQREIVIEGLDVVTTSVRIVADSVWDGNRYHDMCISEATFEGEPAGTTTAVAPPSSAPGAGECVARISTGLRLHLADTLGSEGRVLDSGTALRVLGRGAQRGRDRASYRVSVGDGREGYILLAASELSGSCSSFSGTPPATSAGCTITLTNGVHLRRAQGLASTGREYPPGTRVEVIDVGSIMRAGAAIRRLRVLEGDAEGWAFLTPTELSQCGQ